MVSTRSGRQTGRYESQVERYNEYNRARPCQECQEEDNNYDYGDDPGGHDGDNGPYRARDECNRHRPRDGTPYTEEVVSYRRRKPNNR